MIDARYLLLGMYVFKHSSGRQGALVFAMAAGSSKQPQQQQHNATMRQCDNASQSTVMITHSLTVGQPASQPALIEPLNLTSHCSLPHCRRGCLCPSVCLFVCRIHPLSATLSMSLNESKSCTDPFIDPFIVNSSKSP